MAYIKTNWLARVGTNLNRFLKSNESTGSVDLTPDPSGITQSGTPFTASNMNKIEEGIYNNSVDIDNINSEVLIPTELFKSLNTLAINARGIAFTGTYYLIKESVITDDVYRYDINFNYVDKITLTSNQASFVYEEIAWVNGNLVAYDIDNALFVTFDGYSNTILSEQYKVTNVQDLTFDGTNIISLNSGLSTIIIYDGTDVTATPLQTIDVSSVVTGAVAGLAFCGDRYILFLDTTNKLVYALDILDNYAIVKLTNFSVNISSSLSGSIIEFDGVNLSIIQSGSSDVYKLFSRRLK